MDFVSLTKTRRSLLLFSAFLGCATTAFGSLALGMLYVPFLLEFGWGRAQITFGLFIATASTTLLYPLLGPVLDRYGPRMVGLFALPACALGYALMSLAGGPVWTWYLVCLVFSLLAVASTPLTWSAAITKGFDVRHRGSALGIAFSGVSVAAIFMPGFVLWIEGAYGWRTLFHLFAAFILIVIWPIVWFAIPAENPSSDKQVQLRTERQAGNSPGGYREILKEPNFPLMGAVIMANAFGAGVLMLHFQPMLARFGFTPTMFGVVAGIFGPASLFGRVGAGVALSSRIPPKFIYAAAILSPAISAILLELAPTNTATAIGGIVAAGIAHGSAFVFVSYFAGRLFKLNEFGKAAGLGNSFYAIGFGIGSVLAGWLFDKTQAYTIVTWIVCGVSLIFAFGGYTLGARIQVRQTMS